MDEVEVRTCEYFWGKSILATSGGSAQPYIAERGIIMPLWPTRALESTFENALTPGGGQRKGRGREDAA